MSNGARHSYPIRTLGSVYRNKIGGENIVLSELYSAGGLREIHVILMVPDGTPGLQIHVVLVALCDFLDAHRKQPYDIVERLINVAKPMGAMLESWRVAPPTEAQLRGDIAKMLSNYTLSAARLYTGAVRFKNGFNALLLNNLNLTGMHK